MKLSKKDIRTILQDSLTLQRQLVKILEDYEKMAASALPNEPVENLHIQHLWVIRNALLPAAKYGPELRASAEEIIDRVQLVLDTL